ncbi:GNAT family N-acetyltransferase [Salinimicrobium gaetbulicola]|uniref:GNAT family N-acetyltransferase n=1 Tax=Salinimicrobium gaetbulicola TaxID=999702 RepID=A0ABW3IIP4_9FLAO
MINKTFFKEFPVLETNRLILRKFTLEDAKEVQSMRSDQRVMKHMDSKEHLSIAQSEEFIKENLNTYSLEKGIFWAITEKNSGAFIGDFAFWRIDSKNFRAEIGYTLNPAYWGKGYMKEAMDAALAFGFKKLNLHSFEANINPENMNSRKILERTGFKKEAYFRENYYYDGRFLDSEIYCLLERDFTPRKA